MSASDPLADFAAYLRREADRRAKGGHPGVVRLRNEEIAALAEMIRHEMEKRRASQ